MKWRREKIFCRHSQDKSHTEFHWTFQHIWTTKRSAQYMICDFNLNSPPNFLLCAPIHANVTILRAHSWMPRREWLDWWIEIQSKILNETSICALWAHALDVWCDTIDGIHQLFLFYDTPTAHSMQSRLPSSQPKSHSIELKYCGNNLSAMLNTYTPNRSFIDPSSNCWRARALSDKVLLQSRYTLLVHRKWQRMLVMCNVCGAMPSARQEYV